MAKNIYDLFNERKYGVDYLVEGVDGTIEDVEAFESLDEAALAILDIAQESSNEAIELQAAWYLEDLVIESMMYDDFEEERILSVMEGAMKEKAHKAAEYIKQKWQQIKQWFASTFKAIANHFTSGEELVKKYSNEIPKAIANSGAKVKMPKILNKPDKANDECAKLIEALRTSRISGDKGKEQVLKLVGVDDKKSVGNKVKGFFLGSVVEKPIRDYYRDAEMLKEWAGGKKSIIDNFKKQQKQIDDDFKDILKHLKEAAKADGAGDKEAEIVKNFNFALNLKNSVLSAQLHCNKQVCNMALQIIRKALNTGEAAAKDQKLIGPEAYRTKQDREKAEAYNKAKQNDAYAQAVAKDMQDKAFGKKVADVEDDSNEGITRYSGKRMNESYLPQFEAFEIIEEEDNDDWNW